MAIENGTVVITGATSGFGAASARLIAKRWPNAHLWLTGRRKDRLEALREEIGGGRAEAFVFDIRERSAVDNFAKAAGHEKVSVLINNAGLALGLDKFQDAKVDDWEQMIDTNIKGLLYATRAFIPGMIARKEGHIVNLGSVAGHQIYPMGHVYAATKHFVRAINDAIRLDVQGSQVRVTSIDPGMAETEFSNVRFHGDDARASAVYKGMRPLTPEDVAEAILWSLERPPHVNVQNMILMSTDQASTRDVQRS